jgi:hypothetical protein
MFNPVAKAMFSTRMISAGAELFLLACLLSGCASKSPAVRDEAEAYDAEESFSAPPRESGDAIGGGGDGASRMEYEPPAAPMAMSKASAAPSRRLEEKSARARNMRTQSAPPPLSAPEIPSAAARMVAHEGNITLRSPEPEKVLDSAVALARALGGYLETRRQGWAALKVPSARFDSAFRVILALGDVMAHSRHAQDITNEYHDTELRQKVVAATIDRLEALIDRARNDLQKLRLLGELKRYREEWEAIEARKKALLKRAEYAAISLQVQGHAPVVAGGGEADFPGFAWIRRLDPFRPDTGRGRRLRFSPPAGLVETPGAKMWRATAAEGAEMWARTLKSRMSGDSRFWRDAVWRRLKPQFKAADSSEAGGFLFCRFAAHGPRAYAYWVGVRADGKGPLQLVELYFPDEKQEKAHSEAMLAAVRQGPK